MRRNVSDWRGQLPTLSTPWGQVLAAVIALLGIGTIALPAEILGGAFLEEFKLKEQRYFRHRGEEL